MSRRELLPPWPAEAPTFEAGSVLCRTSSHPPLVIGSCNCDPNRSRGTAHRVGETEPQCTGTDPQLFDYATHENAPGQARSAEAKCLWSSWGGAGDFPTLGLYCLGVGRPEHRGNRGKG